jgi:cation diffusion facilitator CzcD-associated flavoprotein CzcO
VVPDGDLFLSIRAGTSSVVTDQIETFTKDGILLQSGDELKADIIVTATGFNMNVLGDVNFTVDGEEVDFADRWGHRSIQFSDVPNMAWVFGYLRASWTLRADLVAGYVCRLLNHMDAKGVSVVTPRLRVQDKQMQPLPFIEEDNFNAGYIMRKIHLMPRQGDQEPWVHSQDYFTEKESIPAADLDDGTLIYQ